MATRILSEPLDPNHMGLAANALVEQHEAVIRPSWLTPGERAALHDAFLELLVRVANAEAKEAALFAFATRIIGSNAAAEDKTLGYESRSAHRDDRDRAIDALAAYLRGPGGGK